MIDATAKLPTGVIQGSRQDPGAYDECLETVEYGENGNEKIRLQYCTAYAGLGNDTSVTDLLVPAMKMTHPRVRVHRALHLYPKEFFLKAANVYQVGWK